MKKKYKFYMIVSVLFVLMLMGCNQSQPVDEGIFQYKNSYVGDNGAVGNILQQLPNPHGEQASGLELKTTEEPYGIIVNYMSVETTEDVERNNEETALYNASYILALVKNADWVAFRFVEQDYQVTREELENWYEGKDVRDFNSEEELSSFVQPYLENEEKVEQFFNKQ